MIFIIYSYCQSSTLGIKDNFLLPILGRYALKERFVHFVLFILVGMGVVCLCLCVPFITEECDLLCLFGMIKNLHFIS